MEKISWKAKEHFHTEKTSDWYWIVAIVTISIALISIFMNNVIFAILIIVSSFTLSLFASKRPEIIDIEVNPGGVTVGKIHYPYEHLESFWIEMQEHHPRVLLKSKKVFMPYIVVFIEDIDEQEIHQALIKHLPEIEQTEPFLEKVLIYLGF